ncbi:MAG TPA: hypothetical protein VNJ51_01380 [Candidatus Dormibacteraeota bacterium]|nr:hypothetical protein [Candidatus Dormibacteraeota bacterium]
MKSLSLPLSVLFALPALAAPARLVAYSGSMMGRDLSFVSLMTVFGDDAFNVTYARSSTVPASPRVVTATETLCPTPSQQRR